MDLYGSSGQADFRIDDLLDFSNDDLFYTSSSADTSSIDRHHGHSPLIPPATDGVSDQHNHFTADLCFPSDNDVAELEWLSRFAGDDYDGANNASFFNGVPTGSEIFSNDEAFSARSSRSKRSPRPPPIAAGANAATSWIARKSSPRPKRSSPSSEESPSAARRCTHCLSEKTPQWRTGPMGPKTLCNACGVRFKSGRLVPEYRPAASPTFVLTQHSNSHRKVMELRRQKELSRQQSQQPQQSEQEQGQFYSHHQQYGFRVC